MCRDKTHSHKPRAQVAGPCKAHATRSKMFMFLSVIYMFSEKPADFRS